MTVSPADVAKALTLEELVPKVCVVVGTRPGIIMLSPLIRALQDMSADFFVLHSGQHYSPNMDAQFFEDLGLPEPAYKLEGTSAERRHGGQTASMLRGCEEVLLHERPSVVAVGGDANTNLAAALAARKLHMTVGHIEAGERSWDWRMPEEHNRVVIDHISELLFATNGKARRQLEAEGVRGTIEITGNPIVDATRQNLPRAVAKSRRRRDLGSGAAPYLLMTTHREETVDSAEALSRLREGIERATVATGLPVVFPAHPRTLDRLRRFDRLAAFQAIEGLLIIEATGYLEFLDLLAHARAVLTDSGGVQQEACIVGVPCITLRDNTEWTETVAIGANRLTGLDAERISRGLKEALEQEQPWEAPFGDGEAATRIARTLVRAATEGPPPLSRLTARAPEAVPNISSP